MNFIKRVSALLLTVSVMLCVFPAGASGTEEEGRASAEAFGVLKAVGILPPEAELPKDGGEVSRGLFVRWAVQLSGNTDVLPEQSGTVFPDVPAGKENGQYIEAAYNMGYISRDGGGDFRPSEPITGMQALKIMLSVLGYDMLAQGRGGYPAGYISAAQSAGIGGRIGYDTPLTYNSAMLLLLDTAEADIMETVSYGSKTELKLKKGHNLLGQRFSVYTVKGVAEANRYTDLLSPESGLKKGEVIVGGMRMDAGDSGVHTLIGRYVKAYYYEDDNTKPLIRCTLEDSKKNTVIRLDAENFSEFKDYTFSYYENDVLEKISVSHKATLLLNGKMAVLNADALDFETGDVTLISNDGDDIVDVVSVMNYQTFVVTGVSLSNLSVSTKEGVQLFADPSDSDYDFTIKKAGKNIAFADIGVGNVMSYAESTGAGVNYKTILVSDKNVSGAVTEKGDEDIFIDDKQFPASLTLLSETEVGKTGIFRLDTFGTIVAFEGETDIAYGYLNGLHVGTFGRVTCRIFTENGRWVTLDMNSKINFNGERITAEAAAVRLGTSPDSYRQLIRYLVSPDRMIIRIDTAKAADIGSDGEAEMIENDEFRLSYSGVKTYRATPKSFDGTVFAASDAKLFLIPDQLEETAESKFDILTLSDLVNDKQYTIKAFNADEMITAPIFQLSEFEKNMGSNSRFMIVMGIGKIIDYDGNEVTSLKGYWSGFEITFPVGLAKGSSVSDAAILKKGDVIQFTYDKKGSVDYIRKCSSDSGYYRLNGVYSAYTGLQGVVQRTDVSKNKLVLKYESSGTSTGLIINSGTIVSIYDSERNKGMIANIADIMQGDIIVAAINYLTCREIVILR